MLKLKLQYFGHLIQRADSLEKTESTGPVGKLFGQYWLILISNLPKLASRFCWMILQKNLSVNFWKNWKSDGLPSNGPFCNNKIQEYSSGTVEKAMAPHSSTLAWKIPCMEEPGRLQSMGLLGVRHDWATSLSLFTFMHWRRKWQPTPVFLPGESQGGGSLVGCHLWGRTESDTTEAT